MINEIRGVTIVSRSPFLLLRRRRPLRSGCPVRQSHVATSYEGRFVANRSEAAQNGSVLNLDFWDILHRAELSVLGYLFNLFIVFIMYSSISSPKLEIIYLF